VVIRAYSTAAEAEADSEPPKARMEVLGIVTGVPACGGES
jgi:hypothetical protein